MGKELTFDCLRKIEDEEEMTKKTYDLFDEDKRLDRSRASSVEFLTTVRFIEKYLRPGDRILDIGAGTGKYSLFFADKGFEVDALELADRNIEVFEKKIRPDMKLKLRQGNAKDLSAYQDKAFDVVLCFGPLYHLREEEDRQRVLREIKRVSKDEAYLFFSFINHDFIFMTELNYDTAYFSNGDFDRKTMRLNNFPFVFFTPPEARAMLEKAGLEILHEVSSDGASELMADKINAMSPQDFESYLRYHEMICQKPELLGMSNHLLYVCKSK